MTTPRDALAALDPPWRTAFDCAWRSAQNGSVPVGAVVTNAEEAVSIGAIVVSRIGTVRFAGEDALWAGIEKLPDSNAFVASRWPARIGPRHDQFGVLGQLLPLVFYRRRYPGGASITIHRERAPRVASLADELVSSGEHDRLLVRELADALEDLWSRLSLCVSG